MDKRGSSFITWEMPIGSVYNNYRAHFEFPIFQRGFIWKDEQKSLLIHSILIGFPLPNLILSKNDYSYTVIDGKQRLYTIFDFMEDKFRLYPDTPNVSNNNIAFCTFSKLPLKLQQNFLNESLRFTIVEGADNSDIFELFGRLNNFTPISNFTKRTFRSSLMDQVLDLANHTFFQKHYPLTPTARKTQVDNQIVIITSMLLDKELPVDKVNTKATEDYLEYLSKSNKTLETESIKQIIDYMELVSGYLTVREKRKIYKKVDTIVILQVSFELSKKNIDHEIFSEFLKQFFINSQMEYDPYNDLKKSGFHEIKNIKKRVEILKNNFNKFLQQK
ncbi:DUF262 domain-containing protein [Bacillus inaquosorum]|uniref:DUF262 domain-containing protein n=1 Tax=Bacillus inaquosorum TaxID=483913 RepID=UPI0022829950|nr:DUF262 domain-containing protein [Bacillus inaquosorum]MCY7949370.1 DUF262 domain-containing protein [Bacillus inaquosorum]MEC0520503.1 DUF262 domain-containing protein [Bacillus inaquosorum]MEC0607306.1 DUF262 domain-containing protein [Bacillus inaquosorum]